jgi:hypothetical protein
MPHPATVVQEKAARGAAGARTGTGVAPNGAKNLPPHPATVVQAKLPHGAKVRLRQGPPHAATALGRTPAMGAAPSRPASSAQRAEARGSDVYVIYFDDGEIQADAERFAATLGRQALAYQPQAMYPPLGGVTHLHLFAHGNQDAFGPTASSADQMAQWAYDKCVSRFPETGAFAITFHSCMSAAYNLVAINGSKANSVTEDKSKNEIFIFKFGKLLCDRIKLKRQKGTVIGISVTGYVSRTFTDTLGCTRVLKYWGKKPATGQGKQTIDQVEAAYKAARDQVKGTSGKQVVDDTWLASKENSTVCYQATGVGRL